MNYLKKVFLLATCAVASVSFSQSSGESINYGSATIDGNYCLVLDNANEIQEYYTANASDLNWANVAEAVKSTNHHSNNLISYKADFENNQMIIHIHTDRTAGVKDVIWWNEYLKSVCK